MLDSVDSMVLRPEIPKQLKYFLDIAPTRERNQDRVRGIGIGDEPLFNIFVSSI